MAAKLSEDWQGKRSLLECNRYMLENDITDVTFSITHSEKGERSPPVHIRALKTLLLARSSVFHAMFCGELQEQSQIIEVTDVEPGAFKELIRYMYTDEVNLTADNVLSVLYASKKYMVSTLSDLCAKYLEESLTSETAPTLLDQSIVFDMTELIPKCMEKIQSEASAVLASTSFATISPEAFHEVLKRETLNATELEVFNASMRWAEKQCNKQGKKSTAANIRTMLGDNLFLIRFTTMTIDEFNEHVDPREILSVDEAYLVLKYLTAKTAPKNLPFVTRHRNPTKKDIAVAKVTGEKLRFLNDPSVKINYKGNSNLKTRLELNTTRSIQLHGVCIFAVHNLNAYQHILSLDIKQGSEILVQLQNIVIKHTKSGNLHFYQVELPDVVVRRGSFALDVILRVMVPEYVYSMNVANYVTSMSYGHVTITQITGPNILHGLEYSLLD